MMGKAVFIILIIAALIVHYLWGMDYLKQGEELKQLPSEIATIRQALAQLPEPPQGAEQRLAAAQKNLAAQQKAFPSDINTKDVIESILKLADECKVKAIPLVTQPWSTVQVGVHEYRVFRVNVVVEGSFTQLSVYVAKLEGGEFETLFFENLEVTELSEQPEEETAPDEGIPVTAKLDVAIYTQFLASDEGVMAK